MTEVEWDSGGVGKRRGAGGGGGAGGQRGQWDGAKCSDTVTQLTQHSLDKLGDQGGCGLLWGGCGVGKDCTHSSGAVDYV